MTGRFSTTSLPLLLLDDLFSLFLCRLEDDACSVESDSLGEEVSTRLEDFFLPVFICCFIGLPGADATVDLAYLWESATTLSCSSASSTMATLCLLLGILL